MNFSMDYVTTDDLVSLIKNGVGNSIEDALFADFKAQAEIAARRAAKEIAARVSSHINAIRRVDTNDVRVNLDFKMISDSSDAVGEVVCIRDGLPVVAWNFAWNFGEAQHLAGKKLFVV